MPAPSQLQIKTGSLSRLLKEKEAYTKEAEKLQRKVDDLVASGGDQYNVKQQRKVLAESQRMIPDTQQRIAVAIEDLREAMSLHKTETDSPDYIKAQEALEMASV